MKTLLSVAVASIALGVMGAQEVGVTAITTTNKNTIVSVPFTSLAGGNITAKELVKTQGLVAGTQLYVFNGTSYTAWVLSENEWIPATGVSSVDGVSVGIPAEGQELTAGDAIWLIRPAADTATEKTFYVYGTPPTPALTEKTVAAGYNLIANPKQAPKTFTVTNPVKGDQILVPNDGTPDVYIYRVNSKNVGAWRKNNTSVDLPTIGTGLGFWYISKGTGATTITWAE